MGRQQLINLGVILVVNIAIGLSPGSGIDNWGHLGGVLGGAILGWYLCPAYTLIDPWANAFTPATNRPKPELTNGEMMDVNSLGKQSFAVGLFALGLVMLTVIARIVQQ